MKTNVSMNNLYVIRENPGIQAFSPDVSPAEKGRIDSLYFHVPFCVHKCHYCDFYSLVEDGPRDSSPQALPQAPPRDRQAAFCERLIEELRWLDRQFELTPRTIFFGGGTPTLLRVDLWRTLIQVMNQIGVTGRVEEWTVEANPETVTPQLMEVLTSGGVNRISIGAQSFNPHLLGVLERRHKPASVYDAVSVVRSAGIGQINLDLIFAIPGQTLGMLDADLDAALALTPDHLSCYNLTYEPHTPLTHRMHQGLLTPLDENVQREMFQRIIHRLAAAGYEHYEISSWALPGRHCAHNQVYWHNKNWLGLGPSAASHIAGHRWKNEAHLGRYLEHHPGFPIVDYEHLPRARQIGEQLMLGLRLLEGVSRQWLREQIPKNDPRWIDISELTQMGMLQQTDSHLRLTKQGLLVADMVIERLL